MLNKVMLIGNLGSDPEVRQLDSGVTHAKFSLATSRNYKNKSGEKTMITQWHTVVLWRGIAEVAEKYLKKGDKVYIEGEISYRDYEKDGKKVYFTEIVGSNLQMLGSKPSEQPKTQEFDSSNQGDDLPF